MNIPRNMYELAKELNISYVTATRIAKKHPDHLPFVRKVGNQWIIVPEAFSDWVKGGSN